MSILKPRALPWAEGLLAFQAAVALARILLKALQTQENANAITPQTRENTIGMALQTWENNM